jgi:hypothetical protein
MLSRPLPLLFACVTAHGSDPLTELLPAVLVTVNVLGPCAITIDERTPPVGAFETIRIDVRAATQANRLDMMITLSAGAHPHVRHGYR